LFAQGKYDADVLTDGLGERFHGDRLSFKLWPSCRGTHPFIEAALALTERHGLTPDMIHEIVATGGLVQQMLAQPEAQKQAPQTAIDAKFSIPFTTATALVHGRVDLDSFSDEALAKPAVLALAARTRYELDAAATLRDAASGRLAILLKDGRTLDMAVSHPLGAPQNPATEQDLLAKFVDCASRAARPLTPNQQAQVIPSLLRLHLAENVAGVFARLSGASVTG
ncbi:MAG: MmgE/PrpD family protein, partial [Brevundimonas sp.]|nr:MmgE/PrpD family protein [Brevundimonas sp.]